nr:immunoglobulin heavy chain junction region [Mus musculus]
CARGWDRGFDYW